MLAKYQFACPRWMKQLPTMICPACRNKCWAAFEAVMGLSVAAIARVLTVKTSNTLPIAHYLFHGQRTGLFITGMTFGFGRELQPLGALRQQNPMRHQTTITRWSVPKNCRSQTDVPFPTATPFCTHDPGTTKRLYKRECRNGGKDWGGKDWGHTNEFKTTPFVSSTVLAKQVGW